jgi:CubicO group peptidase (beta-lactamase class C family)
MVVAADAVQMDPRALERVEALFHKQIDTGLHPGAALAVYRHGKQVLDLHGGLADQQAGRPVESGTMFVLYSSTKPIAAACLHILWERGKLGWDDLVSGHWPEFAQNGKELITIRHILTHQAGFPDTPSELTWDKWHDWDFVVNTMEKVRPIFEPGKLIAYHPRNFGWVIAELVRRIDGRPIRQFIQEEITGPLGMDDTYLGLPAELESRVSKEHAMEDCDRMTMVTTYNKPEVHAAVQPAGGGIATARDLARFYAMMIGGGYLDGTRVLDEETVAEVTKLQVEGMDHTLERPVSRSLGLTLGDGRMGSPEKIDQRTFGHAGAGTSVGWADPELRLAVGYITNGFRAEHSNTPRLAAISQAVRGACL